MNGPPEIYPKVEVPSSLKAAFNQNSDLLNEDDSEAWATFAKLAAVWLDTFIDDEVLWDRAYDELCMLPYDYFGEFDYPSAQAATYKLQKRLLKMKSLPISK